MSILQACSSDVHDNFQESNNIESFVIPETIYPAKQKYLKTYHVNDHNAISYIDTHFLNLRNLCENVNEIKSYQDQSVLCLTRKIDHELKGIKNLQETKIKFVFANTSGGEINAARKLGLKIHQDEAILIIDKNCHSSCSNYLLPAAALIYIGDEAVITHHGHAARSEKKYALGILKVQERETGSSDFSDNDIVEAFKKFPNHVKKNIIPDVEFAATVFTEDLYITRYSEIVRTLKHRDNYTCFPPSPFLIILGPKYFTEFDIFIGRHWFPENKNDYKKLMMGEQDTQTLLFDFDEHPFYVQGRGFVDPKDCYEPAVSNPENP